MRWIFHVDMDEFIAAVEVLRHPELRGKPVIVGGDGDPTKRGVVSTASYEARAFGVHSAMPLRTALKRCPECVFLAVDGDHYLEASERVMQTLRQFPAVVQVMGWDEAFMAVETDDPERLAREVQQAVLERTGLWCSIGVGDSLHRAKLASAFAKRRGVFRLTRQEWPVVMGHAAGRRAVGRRRQDRGQARSARHPYRRRARERRRRRARRSVRSEHRTLDPAARHGRRRRADLRRAVCAPRPEPRAHVPAGPDRPGRDPAADRADRAGAHRRPARGSGRRAGDRQAADVVVLHVDPRRQARGADRRCRADRRSRSRRPRAVRSRSPRSAARRSRGALRTRPSAGQADRGMPGISGSRPSPGARASWRAGRAAWPGSRRTACHRPRSAARSDPPSGRTSGSRWRRHRASSPSRP